ncbi:unnamed protein product [Schistosoma mattheei]|uniref:Uncharacterized protein n=1 Tax=Schistosoma mattheei TaxID=31246 RepID=A0A183Q210_9TREM|nr:unnamed protein product [Schistosoma mattheei]
MWRKMKIIPVPKKESGDKNVKFRPIAVTSPFLKTMEKLLILPLQPALREHIDPYQNKVEQSEHSSHRLVMDNTSHLLSEPVMMEHSREGKPILPDDHMIGSNEVNSGTPPSFNSNRIKSKGFEKLRSPPLSLPTSPSYSPSFSSYPSSSQHHFENNETSLF